MVAMMLLTWLGFFAATNLVDRFVPNFLETEPLRDSLLGWLYYVGWWTASSLFLVITRIISFFLAFLVAYTLCSPFYSFLSEAAERCYLGAAYADDPALSWRGIAKDLIEALKLSLIGILLSVGALAIGFIPVIGQIVVFFLYICYAALLFIDYPASRKRWGLGRKLTWLAQHLSPTLRLGLLPALIGMLPVINIFLMAVLFPLFTVHATLNFSAIEAHRQPRPGSATPSR